MSDNQNNRVDDVAKKTSKMTLNAKAPAFTPRFNAKAPAFVPQKTPQNTPARDSAPAPNPISINIGGAPAAAPAPKPISISIGSASAAPASPAQTSGAPTADANDEATKSSAQVPKSDASVEKSSAKKEAIVQTPKPSAPATPTATTTTAAADESVADEEEMLLDEHFKEHLSVIFIGHVDAGKSTLGGNILYLTEMVDKRTMEKYEREAKEAGRESWYLSWALDTNQEERAKGKTVEVGRAFFETIKRRYTILDAPGHKNFVPSMLGGAAQADVGVLVISARKGEFETGFERGGQTREHAILAKTSGVRRIIVAINKMDDVTVGWDKARYDEIILKITPFLKKTGYNPKSDIIFLPISGYTGAGVKDRVGSACSWYSGPSLLETLDGLEAIDRKINGPLRIPISEKYRDMGTVVSGKIESGHIKVNQKVIIMPEKRACEISHIYGEDESEEQSAVSGDNVRIKLRGVEEDSIQNGHVIVDARNLCHSTMAFDAQLMILEAKNIMTAGHRSVLHVHTAIEEVGITKLLHKLNAKGQKSRAPPPFVKKGDACIVRVETAKPLCVERFKDFPQLGRFTLRDEGKTIAIGKILKLIDTAKTNPTA
ncbi:translation termination factor GTPase eRF3 [Coemansia sp. RSA 988]|nr:translation termination factor GTPase eRF3 [Coemansia sp. RSA 988]